jgi:capsid protein
MEFGNKIISWSKSLFKKETNNPIKRNPNADFYGNGTYSPLFSVFYNGEKNLGEIGPIKNYRPDYEALRLRSWQSYFESEITQTIMKKLNRWVIGKGLKLQAEPLKKILEMEKIEFNSQEFCETVEARWNAYKRSKFADYCNMQNLDFLSKTAWNNAKIGGDVLVILRYINNIIKVQLVDASHVMSPVYGTEFFPQELPNGNKILNGIELAPNGEHVAYYVRTYPYNFERIKAKNSQGLTIAYLVYGNKYRLDNVRGVPLIAIVLETLKKLERYKEATVGSAEERQKIAFTIEHEAYSTGENPLLKQMSQAFDYNALNNDLPVDSNLTQLANTVAATTNKSTFNLPLGAKLKSLESKNELHFKDFYSINIDIVCGCLDIPPDVARSLYNSNFSASRAALKDWEHTLNVTRYEFATEFYQPIYEFWLETEILKNKIQAPGYLKAKMENNQMVLEAFRSARWAGATVPHIDPLKEVEAERAKLGPLAQNVPLTTIEAATEALNGGEARSNMDQFAKELDHAKQLKLDLDSDSEPNDKNKNEEIEEEES